jgi:hypothetical protein
MTIGEMPIRDYYLLVPPASYQINAFLLTFFGERISVLLAAGAINGLIFVLLLYKALLHGVSKFEAWVITISTILISVFNCSIFNFVFPYTFAMPYASSAFLGSLVCMLTFIDTKRLRHLLLASLFYGLSISLKHEFILFGLILLITPILVKFKSKNWLLKSLLLAALPMSASLIALTASGVEFAHWINFFEWFKNFINSPLLKAFYRRVGVYSIDPLVKYIYHTSLFFFVYAAAVCVWTYAGAPKFSQTARRTSYSFLFILCLLLPWHDGNTGFLWLGIIALAISLTAILLSLLKEHKDGRLTKLCILILSFCLAGTKTATAPAVGLYGSIFWPYYWGAIGVSLTILYRLYPVDILNRLSRGTFFLLLASSISLSNYRNLTLINIADKQINSSNTTNSLKNRDIRDSIENVFVPQTDYESLSPIFSIINHYRDGNSQLLVAPEGSLINFILRMPGFYGIHNLMPTFFLSFKPGEILNLFKSKPPHFILKNLAIRGEAAPYEVFGDNYAQDLMSEINQRYCKLYPDKTDAQTATSKGLELWSNRMEDCSDLRHAVATNR